jgi:hypothetical protein
MAIRKAATQSGSGPDAHELYLQCDSCLLALNSGEASRSCTQHLIARIRASENFIRGSVSPNTLPRVSWVVLDTDSKVSSAGLWCDAAPARAPQ